jgi:2Fe-2S ferredoxin
MPTIKIVENNGTVHEVSGEVGQSVMQAATFAGVPGISADCGGACACATCHGYVDEAWVGAFQPVSESEDQMLEIVPERRSSSRLTCQLVLSADMDGLMVQLPASQF